MPKFILVLSALLLGALPAEAHNNHRYTPPGYKVVCDQHGCVVKFKQPKVRISEHCVYKPWKDRVICRY